MIYIISTEDGGIGRPLCVYLPEQPGQLLLRLALGRLVRAAHGAHQVEVAAGYRAGTGEGPDL